MPESQIADEQQASNLDAFISYARRDASVVLAFVGAAEAHGRSMWIDSDDIPPAAPWRTELGTAIEAANAVVCCLSPSWLRSVECRREYDRALELGKRLIPVLVATTEESPAELGALQWIDARDGAEPAEVATAVLAAIDTDLDRVREHTHWLSRALRWEARGRDRSLLLRGKDLRGAEEWLARRGAEPSPIPLQTEFVVASRRGERRRLQVTVVAALTAVVVALALAAVALIQRDQARSRALAAAAMSQLDIDPERSLLLAREAWSTAPTTQAVSALRSSLEKSRVRVSAQAHRGAVSGVAWSPDGRSLISAGRDGIIRAWDEMGAARNQLDLGAGAVERLSAATATASGVAVTEKGRAVLWFLDPSTGLLTQRAVLGEQDVTDAVTSDDGSSVATGTRDGTVRIWTSAGHPVRTVKWGVTAAVGSVSLSPDGRTLLVGFADGAALAGTVDSDRPTRIANYSYAVDTTQLSADGLFALTAAKDGSGSVRRVSDGNLALDFRQAFHAAMDKAGRRVVVAQTDGRVDVLSVGENPVRLPVGGTPANDVRFSTDGIRLIVAGLDGVARVWQVPGADPLAELRSSSGSATRSALSPDGQRLFTGHGNGEIHVWAMAAQPLRLSLQNPAERESGLEIRATSVAFSPDGQTILTASRDGLARMWDTRTGQEARAGNRCEVAPLGPHCLALQTFLAQGLWLTRATYSRDGRLIATSGQRGSVVVWDAVTADQVSRAPDVRFPVDDVVFSPDGRLLATAEGDGRTRLIDVRTGHIAAELKDSDKRAYAVAFTPDGRSLLAAGEDGLVRLWDVQRRSPRVLASAGDGVLALAIDPAGRQVAVATDDQILLFDAENGHLVRTLQGHVGLVTNVAFPTGGDLLMSGGLDGTVRAWDLQSGDVAALFRVPGGEVSQIGISPEGRRIAAASSSSAGFVFECEVCRSGEELMTLAAAHSTRGLTADERSGFAIP